MGQMTPTARHSMASVQRWAQTKPSAAVSVLTQTPRSGQSALVVHATVHRPICRMVRRLLNCTHRGVASAQAEDDWHEP